jgi:oligoendopeptidase F
MFPNASEDFMIRKGGTMLAVTLLFATAVPGRVLGVERSEIPDRYKWDLTALYPSEREWSAAKDDLEARIPKVAAHEGHLGDSPQALLAALTDMMNMYRDLSRLYTYASQKHDEDTRIAKTAEMKQSGQQLYVKAGAATSWLRPEILAVGSEKIRAFVAAEPGLAEYRQYLDDILRAAPHTLSPAEEAIVAKTGNFAGAGGTVYDLFTNAELPYPEVELTDGTRVRIDGATYTKFRADPDRENRIRVFKAFWSEFQKFQGTVGATLNAQMQAHVFNKDVRKFGSCLEAAMFTDNIPTSVYTQLVADARANLPTLHRYLRLRQRMMGVDQLRYEDLYAPIVKEVDMAFTPEEAQAVTLEAVQPLGTEYATVLKGAFTEGWMDWMPSTGKASGAYSTGAYGVHPFQLQNFTGLYEEVSTLAHEAGHSMHTYYSDQHQPYVTHDYATFVAEVASTLNENLLFHSMYGKAKDRDTKLFLLGSFLDNLRGTLFRQVAFAEFELMLHEMAERGEPISGEGLSERYLKLVREYMGHDQGVCLVDESIATEWAYINHFYYNFYVYQYATSIVAATKLAKDIAAEAKKGGDSRPRRDAFLALISAGSSKYPVDLLKDAGVDMTTSAPFNAAIAEMNLIMDEMEKLLK